MISDIRRMKERFQVEVPGLVLLMMVVEPELMMLVFVEP